MMILEENERRKKLKEINKHKHKQIIAEKLKEESPTKQPVKQAPTVKNRIKTANRIEKGKGSESRQNLVKPEMFTLNPNECEFTSNSQPEESKVEKPLRDFDIMRASLLNLEDARNDSSDNEPGTSDDNEGPPKDDSEDDNGELN